MRNVARVLIATFLPVAVLAISPALAQSPRRQPQQPAVLTGDFIQDAKNGFKGDPNDPTAGIKLTGNIKKDAEALWAKIQAAALPDLQYASAMAGAAGTNGAEVRKACWDAIIVVNQQSNGAELKDADNKPLTKPDPHLFTDVETAAEILDNLSPQGKLFTSCAGAAQLAQANVIQFISAAISGAAGIAKLTPIPGL